MRLTDELYGRTYSTMLELGEVLGMGKEEFRAKLIIKNREERFVTAVLKAKRWNLPIEKIIELKPVRSSIG